MKRIGVTGYKGKIGSILAGRPNCVTFTCDITDKNSIDPYYSTNTLSQWPFEIIVNCAAISSIDQCENEYQKAIEVNSHGLTNLHRVFGEKVLNISSGHVFNGRAWRLPTEETPQSPINNYGLTKLASEMVSMAFEGKTIRLSRTLSINDPDIREYLGELSEGREIKVPDFFSRNYLHRDFAVDGIEYMVNNWNNMPQLVNYGGTENVTMFSLMKMIAMRFGLNPALVTKKKVYDDTLAPRPLKGGFNVSLAKSLGFPMYNIADTVEKLWQEL